MENYKIFSYLNDVEDSYGESIEISPGLMFNHGDTIRTVDFYSNNKYLSGNKDSLGREKPFYNVCNFRVTVAKTATDLDVKDISYEPESLDDSVKAMLINHELFKFLKEINFSETLNDMGKTRPKYGGVLIKKYDDGEGTEIEVVDWKNVKVDPCDISSGVIVETHYMQPDELGYRSDVWDNVEEVLKAHAKANKNKPARIEVKEVSGVFPVSFNPEYTETDSNESKFERMCFYIACVNKKKYLLDHKTEKESRYKYLAWEKVPGRSLGRGVVEEGFESQVWVNDTMISMKNAMDLSGKVVLSTTSKKVSGNAITGVDNGHIFELEEGKTITSLNLLPSAFPQFENMIALWNTQYDRVSSTYDANTGEAPTAGTPYSQTALLNQVANSPFEYQREVWGIFLNEVLNDWILPDVKKRILKDHYLVSEFTGDELEMIDQAIKKENIVKYAIGQLTQGQTVNPAAIMGIEENVDEQLKKLNKKREIKIPKGWLDIEGKITANITGELKNKAVMLQSFDSILKTVVSSFNPQTGQYGVLTDPTLSKIFGKITEMAGIPFASLAPVKSPIQAPMQQPDMSAVQPVAPVA